MLKLIFLQQEKLNILFNSYPSILLSFPNSIHFSKIFLSNVFIIFIAEDISQGWFMSSFISNCPLKNASLSGKLSHNGPFEQQKPYVDARSEALTTPEATIEIGQSCPATAPSGSNPDSPSWMLAMLALAAEVTNKQIHERNSNYQHVLLKLSSDLEHKLLSPLSPPSP